MNIIALEGRQLVIVVCNILIEWNSMGARWLDIVDEIVLLRSRSFRLGILRRSAIGPYARCLLHLVLIRSQPCLLLLCMLPNRVFCGERYQTFGDQLLLVLLLFTTKPFHVLVERLRRKQQQYEQQLISKGLIPFTAEDTIRQQAEQQQTRLRTNQDEMEKATCVRTDRRPL